ncbi:MAG: hypothetical protein R2684_09230 [Pyrinomonadaceae bacterium]
MLTRVLTASLLVLLATFSALAQRTSVKKPAPQKNGNLAIVVDERLSLLRSDAGLYTMTQDRLKIGEHVTVMEEKEADGVLFFRVATPSAMSGWVQAEALSGSFRKNEDFRLSNLILSSDGRTQIERSAIFLELFPKSDLRPSVLLLFGDLLESMAEEISLRASESLVRREMAAARAPLHSFYLNYPELDPYLKLGVKFLFNDDTLKLHYNGDSWFELTNNFPNDPLTIEARERIKSLEKKLKKSQ